MRTEHALILYLKQRNNKNVHIKIRTAFREKYFFFLIKTANFQENDEITAFSKLRLGIFCRIIHLNIFYQKLTIFVINSNSVLIEKAVSEISYRRNV